MKTNTKIVSDHSDTLASVECVKWCTLAHCKCITTINIQNISGRKISTENIYASISK